MLGTLCKAQIRGQGNCFLVSHFGMKRTMSAVIMLRELHF